MIVRAGTIIVKLQQLIIILFSQCSTLVRNTVVKAIHSFNGKVGNSTLRGSVTPEPIEMKLCMVDMSVTRPHMQQLVVASKKGSGGRIGEVVPSGALFLCKSL